MRKTIKHKVYTFEEKIQIVHLYLDHHMGTHEIVRKYDLSDNNVYVFTCLDTVKVLLNGHSSTRTI